MVSPEIWFMPDELYGGILRPSNLFWVVVLLFVTTPSLLKGSDVKLQKSFWPKKLYSAFCSQFHFQVNFVFMIRVQ